MKAFLLFGCAYFLFEFIIHFLNIRLWGVEAVWSPAAQTYATIMNQFYGSLALFISILLFLMQKNMAKYKSIIILTGLWTLFHGLFLIYLSLVNDFSRVFAGLPQLTLWFPFYNQYLLLEALVLFSYALTVWRWIGKKDGKEKN